MSEREAVIKKIQDAFSGGEGPPVNFLQGSFDGCEPYEETSPFKSKSDWRGIEASFLDAHASALSFFSEGGFRYFLPAYLIADLRGELDTADPLFHLTHGFTDASRFVNPRRYGAMTFYDYARCRLSVFTREEAGAIVAYLEFKRDFDPDVFDKPRIDAALESFWLERARTAPPGESLERYLAEQEEYMARVRSRLSDSRISDSRIEDSTGE